MFTFSIHGEKALFEIVDECRVDKYFLQIG